MRLSTLMRIVAGAVLTTFVATFLLLSSVAEDGDSGPGPASTAPEPRAFAVGSVTA